MSRNVFFFFCFAILSFSGCKSSNSFCSGKRFEKFFWKIIFRFLLSILVSFSRNVARFAGCKGNIRFRISQTFLNLFSKINFLSVYIGLSGFLWTSASLRVQKYTTNPLSQTFFKSIFKVFFNGLVFWYLQVAFFVVLWIWDRSFWGFGQFWGWQLWLERWLGRICHSEITDNDGFFIW